MDRTCRIDVEKYRAVLFDLDGVITDTMGLHYEAYRQAFKKYGIDVTEREIFLREGMPSMDVGQAIVAEKGVNIPEDQLRSLVEEKREIYRAMAEKEARAFPGVIRTLAMLKDNGVRRALVTGSNRISVAKTIKKAGLEDAFDTIVTADETSRGKPFPDPYLKGMEKLGVRKEHCVVVENAPLGIQSARAAGAGYVIGVTTTLPAECLKDADDIMGSFIELEQCLARRLTQGTQDTL